MAFIDGAPILREYISGKTLAGTRVYVEGLPPKPNLLFDSVETNQLAKTIVIKSAYGTTDSYLPVAYPRYHIRCYAPSKSQCSDLFFELMNTIHNVTIDNGGRLVIWLNAGPIYDIEPETKFIFADGYYTGVTKG